MAWRWPWAPLGCQWRLRYSARKIGRSGEQRCIRRWMRLTRPFLLGPEFFRMALPPSIRLSNGEGLDAVTSCSRVNFKNDGTTETVPDIRAKRFVLDDRNLKWHDYPSLMEGENHGILLVLPITKYYSLEIGRHCEHASGDSALITLQLQLLWARFRRQCPDISSVAAIVITFQWTVSALITLQLQFYWCFTNWTMFFEYHGSELIIVSRLK